MKPWYIYMIRCHNGHLYTGITIDIHKRFNAHIKGNGAKYLKGKSPLTLVWLEEVSDKSTALRLEAALKQKPKVVKESLIR